MSTALTQIEKTNLLELESIIERGRETFCEVGAALMRIRDERLYRESHKTFEEYCRERWTMSRSRAYQLIEATKTAEILSTTVDKKQLPSEFTIRPLSKIEPELRAGAYEEAVKTAPGGKVTAKHVEEIAERIKKQVPALANKVVVTPSDSSTLKDSYRLQELKYHWKNATKKEREAFLEWIKN